MNKAEVYVVIEEYADIYGLNREVVAVCKSMESASKWIAFNKSNGCGYDIEPFEVEE